MRSPSDRLTDVEWKMHAYLHHGGLVALDALPDERAIRAFTHGGMHIFTEDDSFACDAVPWLCFGVRDVFSDLDDAS